MDSSKTANMLMVAYNYEKQGRKVVVMKPAVDTRYSEGKIISRLGIERECININDDSNLEEIIKEWSSNEKLDCILIDECQFISPEQVMQLVNVVDDMDIPVICYGLKNSYVKGNIFPGSQALLYYADSIEEIKNVCAFCNRKATMNLRVVDGEPTYSGNLVEIGDTNESKERYYPACRTHYLKYTELIKNKK